MSITIFVYNPVGSFLLCVFDKRKPDVNILQKESSSNSANHSFFCYWFTSIQHRRTHSKFFNNLWFALICWIIPFLAFLAFHVTSIESRQIVCSPQYLLVGNLSKGLPIYGKTDYDTYPIIAQYENHSFTLLQKLTQKKPALRGQKRAWMHTPFLLHGNWNHQPNAWVRPRLNT